MKKFVVIAAIIILGAGLFQPVSARDGFLGGGIYTGGIPILPVVRFGFEDTYIFDFGLNFSTVKTNNYAVMFKGLGRFAEFEDVYVHGGAGVVVAEVGGATAFQFNLLVGMEAPINDSFSVTADVSPFVIQGNGKTEALFLQGYIGMNFYLP